MERTGTVINCFDLSAMLRLLAWTSTVSRLLTVAPAAVFSDLTGWSSTALRLLTVAPAAVFSDFAG
ncbi:unnamed protein product [Periconia digitata]|uniref:Uncharacterized protein n=1 Tax=Periconia digitata TaxID=1303443 RepID=A0A9W4XRS3_9PLEO|nr:unnamed protein product [Periconia digitata]